MVQIEDLGHLLELILKKHLVKWSKSKICAVY